MSERTLTTARVRVTVELDLSQPWSQDATLAEVYKRGGQEALDKLSRLMSSTAEVRVIGKPEVTAILVAEKP